MFGGDDTNPLFPVSMDNMRVPYNGYAGQLVQLEEMEILFLGDPWFQGTNIDSVIFAHMGVLSNTCIMNMIGNKNASSANLPMKVSLWTPVYSQHKLPVTLHDNICLDGCGQAKSMLKQIPVSIGLKLSRGEEEYNSSVSSGENTMPNLSSMLPHSDCLRNELVQQNDELDQYIRVQEENIRKGINELKHRHTISLLNSLEKVISSKLQEKDIEIGNLNLRNKELTDKIKQITLEAQSWHHRAKQNESLVHFLKSNINQVFFQGAAYLREGVGESMVDDGASSCNRDPLDRTLNCKTCKVKEISVLLLPCRHLCLCIECDALIISCPVCRVKKAGSLQVYMS